MSNGRDVAENNTNYIEFRMVYLIEVERFFFFETHIQEKMNLNV